MASNAASDKRRPEYSSLRRGLEILTLLQGAGRLKMSDVVERLEMPLSTTYRYVDVLREAGYLVEVDGYLVPTEKLAESEDDSSHLVRFSEPLLRSMRSRLSLTAVMTVRVRTAALCLDAALAHPRHRIAFQRGGVHSLHAGASVLPLLAFAPPSVIREVTASAGRRYTSATPSIGDIEEEIARVRTNGFAASSGHVTPGMAAIGIPVMLNGRCLCALSLVGESRAIADVDTVLGALEGAAQQLLAKMSPTADHSPWVAPPA